MKVIGEEGLLFLERLVEKKQNPPSSPPLPLLPLPPAAPSLLLRHPVSLIASLSLHDLSSLLHSLSLSLLSLSPPHTTTIWWWPAVQSEDRGGSSGGINGQEVGAWRRSTGEPSPNHGRHRSSELERSRDKGLLWVFVSI
ncbi:hypothetical protein Hanom_Chr06g00545561 [Helianthus anomalus]